MHHEGSRCIFPMARLPAFSEPNFYEKASLVKPTWRLWPSSKAIDERAPSLRFYSHSARGRLSGDPVHDEIRPDLRALQSIGRPPSEVGPSRIAQSPKRPGVSGTTLRRWLLDGDPRFFYFPSALALLKVLRSTSLSSDLLSLSP